MKRIRNIYFLILVGILSACNNHSSKKEKSTNIIVATDLHFLSSRINDHGECFTYNIERSDGKVVTYCEELVKAFVDQVIEKKPNALILSGDLTFNGAKESHEDLSLLLQPIVDHGIDVYTIPGNHDLYNSNAVEFVGDSYNKVDSISSNQFKDIYNNFGFKKAYSSDEKSLSYICNINPNLNLLMIDTNSLSAYCGVSNDTFSWIKDVLEESKRNNQRVIAVTHQNLLRHNPLFSFGYEINNSNKLINLFKENDVICNLSGHLHLQHFAQSDNGIYDIATSALAITPCQYGAIKVFQDKLTYQTEEVDVSSWARNNNYSDNNLLDFSKYAYDFFYKTAYNQALRNLDDVESKEDLACFFAKNNTLYFQGKNNQLESNSELYARWLEQNTSLSSYIDSFMKDSVNEYNKLDIFY